MCFVLPDGVIRAPNPVTIIIFCSSFYTPKWPLLQKEGWSSWHCCFNCTHTDQCQLQIDSYTVSYQENSNVLFLAYFTFFVLLIIIRQKKGTGFSPFSSFFQKAEKDSEVSFFFLFYDLLYFNSFNTLYSSLRIP